MYFVLSYTHKNAMVNIITGSVLHPHIADEAWILMPNYQKLNKLRSQNVLETKMSHGIQLYKMLMY